jgi:peptidoglycan/LPS O-acetylase OafA/YrhL
MVLWAIVNQGQRVTALLRHGALMRLGSLCYGMYLLQRPTEVVLVKVLAVAGFDLDAWPTTSLVCKFIAAWGVAALSWRFFEEPINRLKVRFKSAHHPLA